MAYYNRKYSKKAAPKQGFKKWARRAPRRKVQRTYRRKWTRKTHYNKLKTIPSSRKQPNCYMWTRNYAGMSYDWPVDVAGHLVPELLTLTQNGIFIPDEEINDRDRARFDTACSKFPVEVHVYMKDVKVQSLIGLPTRPIKPDPEADPEPVPAVQTQIHTAHKLYTYHNAFDEVVHSVGPNMQDILLNGRSSDVSPNKPGYHSVYKLTPDCRASTKGSIHDLNQVSFGSILDSCQAKNLTGTYNNRMGLNFHILPTNSMSIGTHSAVEQVSLRAQLVCAVKWKLQGTFLDHNSGALAPPSFTNILEDIAKCSDSSKPPVYFGSGKLGTDNPRDSVPLKNTKHRQP